MMGLTTYCRFASFLLLLQFNCGCHAKPGNSKQPSASTVATTRTVQEAPAPKGTDEQQFRQFLQQFKVAVRQKNKQTVINLFNFPLQTTPQWTNEDLANMPVNPAEGLVDKSEFVNYYNDIFTADAVRLIPKSREDELSEIERTTSENYYQTVAKVTDQRSKLYELQIQYAQDNGKETSFGFVFGKVKGNYKVISYYRPWPLKG